MMLTHDVSIIYGPVIDPHDDKLPVGLITQLAEQSASHVRSDPRSGLNFSSLSRYCLINAENCLDPTQSSFIINYIVKGKNDLTGSYCSTEK